MKPVQLSMMIVSFSSHDVGNSPLAGARFVLSHILA